MPVNAALASALRVLDRSPEGTLDRVSDALARACRDAEERFLLEVEGCEEMNARTLATLALVWTVEQLQPEQMVEALRGAAFSPLLRPRGTH